MRVIVPIDFSDMAVNAADFAAKMLSESYKASMILYHVYKDESEETLVMENLKWLKETFELKNSVKIECKAEKDHHFIASLSRLARFEDADMIIMSVNHKSKIMEGSHSLEMIEQNICPVLVIPPGFEFSKVKNVGVACDFKDVQHTIPVVPIKKFLNIFRPKLHILNVNSEIYVSINEAYMAQRQLLIDIFGEYHPEFHFINTFDFHETLRNFIADKNIDILLTFPRKHSFINNLIKGTNTKKIVYETAVPVLAAHE